MPQSMYLVEVYPAHEWARPKAPFDKFVCADESRANFLAGQVADRMTDETGESYIYQIAEIQVR